MGFASRAQYPVSLPRRLVASSDSCWSIGVCNIEVFGYMLHWSRSWRGCRGTGRPCRFALENFRTSSATLGGER